MMPRSESRQVNDEIIHLTHKTLPTATLMCQLSNSQPSKRNKVLLHRYCSLSLAWPVEILRL